MWRNGKLCALLKEIQNGAYSVENDIEVSQNFKSKTIT